MYYKSILLQDQSECHSVARFVSLPVHQRFPAYSTNTRVYHICPRNFFISVNVSSRVSQDRLAPLQMTAAVYSLTLHGFDRGENSKHLSGGVTEPAACAAPAINISQNNNHGCLFSLQLSVGLTDVFLRTTVLTDSGGDSDCSVSLCARLPPV